MKIKEIKELWTKYFNEPMPEGCIFFWRGYSPELVEYGLKATHRKLSNDATVFPTMSDAARYATSVMKSQSMIDAMEELPAPTAKAVSNE